MNARKHRRGEDAPAKDAAELDLLPRGPQPRTVTVTRDGVEGAAPQAPEGSVDVASVTVAGRSVRAYELMALAAGRRTTEISSRQAVRALQEMGFAVTGPAGGARPPAASPQGPGAPAPSEQPVLDPRTAKDLRRYPGEWVAVRGRHIAAHGPSLRAVLAEARPSEDDPATVLWVPRGAGEARA